eukprot:CAMPEP_0183308410 /NCGR_PEP_ID=MMETSP0160_2-20130417/21828_1 /TAXON_ID=2839 ORGANISM="Odontella Sinensis, Strain Grunow 1884" /NCGR_SAMPLE_ID=MMETSP0160_2 /ASSEMBLY_ACC=CAM_ASM_000250 /LENGTH=211 /DNA_ID=CAMNT_0025472251 /DNA_START=109 /DNA_END=744 /DNA_ORIENTATION=+
MATAGEKVPLVKAELIPTDETSSPPTGKWRDGLCSCCKPGCFHASLWCACCCPTPLMGQVLTRMKMNWLGSDASGSGEWKQTFKKVLFLVIAVCVYDAVVAPIGNPVVKLDENDEIVVVKEANPTVAFLNSVVGLAFFLYTLVVLMKLRAAVRARYQIPEKRCHGCEDCCLSFWCTCCTVAQLARHTADYDEEGGACCSETGLPGGVSAME